MRASWLRQVVVLLAVLALVAAACGEDEPTVEPGAPTGPTEETATGPTGETETGDDLLAKIQEDGVIRVSTDGAYPPQSELNEETGGYEGFDIDVATEIANRLGVRVEWTEPAWEAITAGHWNDRWDMSVGSMTVTPERAEVLHFTPAYYFSPASIAVHEDNTTITDLANDLDGKTIGVCGGCTYDFYLQGTLEIPGYEFNFVVDDPRIVTYDTDTTAIQDLALGDGARLDAVMSALPTLERAINRGRPIKIVGDPLFGEPLAVAIDRSSSLDPTSLVDRVSQIIEEMHADGTLTELSMKWYGTDLSEEPSI
ncbi:MAG TPA: transporter substrate-binding domain-containing protein [Actinomycetota bacterium]|nr:transporter substrate-binding domain-containing protein [Actinomycetota bacterium]